VQGAGKRNIVDPHAAGAEQARCRLSSSMAGESRCREVLNALLKTDIAWRGYPLRIISGYGGVNLWCLDTQPGEFTEVRIILPCAAASLTGGRA
jgi:hypothetical protein